MRFGTDNESFIGSGVWLFPATYLVHIAEEYWGGFPRWIARFWGVESAITDFLIWNGAAWLMMSVGVMLIFRLKSFRWLLVSFATVVLINGVAHIVGSLVTWSYSPGLVSGLLLFLPLGTIALLHTWKSINRRTFRRGVAVGFLLHMVVVLLAFGFARISSA